MRSWRESRVLVDIEIRGDGERILANKYNFFNIFHTVVLRISFLATVKHNK